MCYILCVTQFGRGCMWMTIYRTLWECGCVCPSMGTNLHPLLFSRDEPWKLTRQRSSVSTCVRSAVFECGNVSFLLTSGHVLCIVFARVWLSKCVCVHICSGRPQFSQRSWLKDSQFPSQAQVNYVTRDRGAWVSRVILNYKRQRRG